MAYNNSIVNGEIFILKFYGLHSNDRSGFTLIELSIVLVIIGLIVGGVLVGRDLIEAANIRAQIKQVEQYTLAFNTFKIKYNCIPGDCRNATEFFSGTANGNGNGIVENTNDASADWYIDGEQSHFFEQLSMASLIPGKFDSSDVIGVGYPTTIIYPKKGITVGKGNYEASYALLLGSQTEQQSPDAFTPPAWRVGLFFTIGDYGHSARGLDNDTHGVFTPSQMLSMDTKLDDGKPHTGVMRGAIAHYSVDGNCSTGMALTDTYLLTNALTGCHMGWKLD